MIFFEESQAEFAEGVWVQRNLPRPAPFESGYLALREKEGRILRDEQVKQLPVFVGAKALEQEWAQRAHSAERFYKVLQSRGKVHSILEVGCGNGWALSRCARLPGVQQLVGLDRNFAELSQAARCFPAPTFAWIYADVMGPLLKPATFDVIFLAAAVQYFPGLTALIRRLRELLRPGGIICIWDSPFYAEDKVQEAARRTKQYYLGAGFEEMAAHYFHHSLAELKAAGAKQQGTFLGKVFSKLRRESRSPFELWVLE